MSMFLTLALAASATPATVSGFNASELSEAAQTREVAEDRIHERLDAAAESLRLAIALDPAKALASASPDEAQHLREALALGDAGGDLRARWFMAGAIGRTYIGALATAFYNPLARGWLIVAWAPRDGSWVVARVLVVAAQPSDWIDKPGPYLANFLTDYRQTESEFGRLPGSGGKVEPVIGAGIAADRWIASLAIWLRDPAKAKAADRVRNLIAAGDTGKLGGAAIASLPQRARVTFWPIASFARADRGGSLIYGSPLYPRILIAADFDGDARSTLTRLTLINLANVEVMK